jgi:hypothetical protein
VRVVALLASFNEERFIGGCLEHLAEQGVESYLIDNCSTDDTVEIASEYLGNGLIGIERLPRPDGLDRLKVRLKRKDELAVSLDADWFMHMDPDEIRLPPRPDQTLAQAFEDVDFKGYNAVNFVEFTFIPTHESPEHDHPDFQRTMRWYYPFARRFPHHVKAWKKQPKSIELEGSGGHLPKIPNLLLYPVPFKMRHYQFLSLEQAREKYLQNKKVDRSEVAKAKWRNWLDEEKVGLNLPSEKELNTYTSDGDLSLSNPRRRHIMEDWALPKSERVESSLPSSSDAGTAPRNPEESPRARDEGPASLSNTERLRKEKERFRQESIKLREERLRLLNQLDSQETEENRKLINWLEQLDTGIEALLGSRRWKIGDAAGKILDVITRRQETKTAANHLQKVLGEFRDWKSRNGDPRR